MVASGLTLMLLLARFRPNRMLKFASAGNVPEKECPLTSNSRRFRILDAATMNLSMSPAQASADYLRKLHWKEDTSVTAAV